METVNIGKEFKLTMFVDLHEIAASRNRNDQTVLRTNENANMARSALSNFDGGRETTKSVHEPDANFSNPSPRFERSFRKIEAFYQFFGEISSKIIWYVSRV